VASVKDERGPQAVSKIVSHAELVGHRAMRSDDPAEVLAAVRLLMADPRCATPRVAAALTAASRSIDEPLVAVELAQLAERCEPPTECPI